LLELVNLTRRYGNLVALDGLSFSVSRGEVVGFLGPNGAGKTTTMRIVAGVLEPDEGEVRWDGHPLTAAGRRRLGYMPEERGLYPRMRLKDQLVYFARLHGLSGADAERRAADCLERLGLEERSGSRIEELSHGNQQRAQLAAALVHEPDFLLLDEPFSGLDPVAVDTLGGLLGERAAAGNAVVFSSHQLDLVEHLCERVAIVDRGRLVAEGRVADLKERSGHRRLLVGVEVSPGTAAWADAIPDVTVLERRNGRVLL
jgi:ABC-2 type transport system ATP-binding protein